MQLLETDPNDPTEEFRETLKSDNGRFRMVLLKGGNLQLQQGKRVMWESKTHGTGPFTLRMQDDNNLVLYDCKGKTIPGTNDLPCMTTVKFSDCHVLFNGVSASRA